MKKSQLRQYAKLLATMGGGVKKGMDVVISAETDQPEFVKMLVEECYRAGARKVEVDWHYQPLQKLNVRHQSQKTLGTLAPWEVEKLKYRAETLPVMMYLLSEDPDGLRGMNQKKQSKATQERYKIIKPIRDTMENKYPWCIAAVPSEAWAKKLFPNDRKSVAVNKLWDAILATARVTDDPIKAWEDHNRDLAARSAYLNSLHIKKLHYKAENGTDFTVGLMPESRFAGGEEKTLSGVRFNPNMPTEEVFTSPKRGEAEGTVVATMPLSYRGELIEGFSMRFEGGKVVECHADKNEELLKQLVSMDDGAAYLGECALVPYDSPIRKSGILFYNTLFDENAACHLALGMGFADCVDNFQNRTLEECHKLGVNDSIIHEDFMIGCADLSITAETEDGKTVQIFQNGGWAF